jgi:2-polyprenyl-3-methyl-5-hydroxy-6-metoxy-1,4-benzoquinol methylase
MDKNKAIQTAERSSHLDSSENVIYQRCLIPYKEAAKIVSGTILEIGSGEGYGIMELASKSEHYIAIDKYDTYISEVLKNNNNITFIKAEVPPLKDIAINSVDFVISFQVIEHVQDDVLFLQEIYRVLKPGGQVILTTPNKLMSITRNPWHIREYTPVQMEAVLKGSFDNYEIKGVFGNEKIMEYYRANKTAVLSITRFDILKMQYWLPRWMLEIPYDILNRFNRRNMQLDNKDLVKSVVHTDFSISTSTNECFDHFCIATK